MLRKPETTSTRRAVFVLAFTLALAGVACKRKEAPAPRPSTSAPRHAVSAPSASAPEPSARDVTVWNVPVSSDDPSKGNPDALVTIIAFSELESPLCREAAQTLDSVLEEFPNDLRIVWKDFPLPFDASAMPAALFLRAVYAERGNEAFWKVQQQLFAAQPKLEASDFEAVAKTVELPASLVNSSRSDPSLRSKVMSSVTLGYDVQAKGIPHFFINGTRLAGSQPLAKVRAIVEAELEKARVRVAAGISRASLYEGIVREGRTLPALARVSVDAPDRGAPTWGARDAPVTIEIWQRVPCHECPVVLAQALALERESEGRVRLVFRFFGAEDADTRLAAQSAREAFAARGYDGFKSFYESLGSVSEPRKKPPPVARQYEGAVRAESLVAERAGIVAPSFVVNGYRLPIPSGNFELRRAIAHAALDRLEGR
jgi:protein-disulfide isomerase